MGTATPASERAWQGPAASPAMQAYFNDLRRRTEVAHGLACAARALGFDPSADVEVVLAEDLAARVEAQTEIAGIAVRVRELSATLSNREVVALQAAKEVAAGRFGAFPAKAQAIDKAVRVGLSILTEGVLVAPLEGIGEVRLGTNADGTDYVDLYFAGPIRAAGGTAQAMSVLIADVVRHELGVGAYQPTDAEVERYQEEIPAYKRAAHLQYTPSVDEIAAVVRQCPVCVNGEGTERVEVTGHRDLPRVATNRLRGGACLVIAEGLCLKAPKLAKHVKALGLDGWDFLDRFIGKVEEAPAVEDAPEDAEEDAGAGAEEDAEEEEDAVEELASSDKYIKELIAGRPVFAHPSRRGGFRLRYGRSPTGGLASTAIHPVTMHALNDVLAVGTQIKIERPGKGTIATPCDVLDGPTVLLASGDLVVCDSVEVWRRVARDVVRITDLGEILIPFGEFIENNHVLSDASYVHEWWIQDLEAAAGAVAAGPWRTRHPTYAEAVDLARRHGVPLHPDHTLMWHDVTPEEWVALRDHAAATGAWEDGTLVLAGGDEAQRLLIELNAPYTVREDRFRLTRHGQALLDALGLAVDGQRMAAKEVPTPTGTGRFPVVDHVARVAGYAVKPRAPTRIGARMGRPEKADARKMNPPVHALYPLGQGAGGQRKVQDALKVKPPRSAVGRRRCLACGREDYLLRCRCGGGTQAMADPPVEGPLRLKEDVEVALRRLGLRQLPDPVKAVKGLMSASRWPEPLEKGILRARHRVWVFKDGTVRFDMTDAPLTHFRPQDIGTDVGRLRDLGYTTDAQGAPLERPDQLVELKVQDLVISRAGGQYLLRASRYVDDLLAAFYGMEPFYRAEHARDLVGHLVVGLAPHTSSGVLGRILGYTDAQVGWAHPFWHAAKRRNCDGDEDAVMLLMDCFLNFSRGFVPDRRGGLMDLPLVLTTRLDPREIDKEAQNLDAGSTYPRALYEATQTHMHPKEVVHLVDLVEGRLGTPAQYEGIGVTHVGSALQQGPLSSSYKTLGTMLQKMESQLSLADRLRAVDAADVADRVVSTHLLPDLLGNLKAFTRQKVRCTKCNTSYRRVPLGGRCTKASGASDAVCGNPLTLTVHQASVKKYLAVIEALSARYDLPNYTKERILLARQYLEQAFAPDRFVTPSLAEFA